MCNGSVWFVSPRPTSRCASDAHTNADLWKVAVIERDATEKLGAVWRDSPSGVLLTSVKPDGAAARCGVGVCQGLVLSHVNSQRIRTTEELLRIIDSRKLALRFMQPKVEVSRRYSRHTRVDSEEHGMSDSSE
eukprot:TRINITY_DN1963_c2_g2_i1.p1 TRINITY_DN1963_c2_g2~~TRINITY_DN1963_c2_g2_i1.p1  ORF type:complete len:133 (+),score=32.72 TRINITY_DN1963_c2_g2_i1:91-489(+)